MFLPSVSTTAPTNTRRTNDNDVVRISRSLAALSAGCPLSPPAPAHYLQIWSRLISPQERQLHSTLTYAHLRHHPSFSPSLPFSPAQFHRHPSRWRTQRGSTRCKGSARVATTATLRPRAAPKKSSQLLQCSNRSERRRSDVGDHTGDRGPPAQIIIRQPMREITPPRRRRQRRAPAPLPPPQVRPHACIS